MTNREREIYNLIAKNPLISQQEIADILGIQRSSVAVQISSLIKKGIIKGKGYILDGNDYVLVIGGSNMDILGFPKDRLVFKDSNPGNISMSMGGVARNISENLARLGVSTKLLTALGDDIYGKKILRECKELGIDLDTSIISSSETTSIYLSILDEHGDMQLALSDSEISKLISVDYISKNSHILKNAKLIVIDTNLEKSVIDYILENFSHIPIFADTVSTKKASKLKDNLARIFALKPNMIEAEILTGIKIEDEGSLNKAMDRFLEIGLGQVFISMGKDGVFYGDRNSRGLFKPKEVKMVNATGAGDAFLAGIIYGFLGDKNIEKAVRYGAAMGQMAVSSQNTINEDVSFSKIEEIVKEMEKC